MKKQNIPAIIFFGAIWGIIEATLGYLLHLLPISIYISGSVMFPVVAYILYKAYAVTKSKPDLLSIGLIAALIKAINFLMPFGSPFKIINPMLSIIMESLMVVLVISLLNKKDVFSKTSGFLLASFGWRLLYLGYMGVQFFMTGFISDYLVSFSAAFDYVVVYGLISTAFALAFVYLDQLAIKNFKFKSIKNINPLISVAALLVAIVLTIFM